jgi:hypothetical protein
MNMIKLSGTVQRLMRGAGRVVTMRIKPKLTTFPNTKLAMTSDAV